MRSVKHPFLSGKLPVRGQFRVACMIIGSAAVTNVRRIQRYLEVKTKEEKKNNNTSGRMENGLDQVGISFIFRARSAFEAFTRLFQSSKLDLNW